MLVPYFLTVLLSLIGSEAEEPDADDPERHKRGGPDEGTNQANRVGRTSVS
jgi:hypothetical protein